MRPLLVGEAPARSGEGLPPFTSASGRRLSDLLGQDLHEVFDCVNLLGHWPGASSKGSKFDLEEARLTASNLRRSAPHTILVLVGKRVARAFGSFGPKEYYVWHYFDQRYPASRSDRPRAVVEHRIVTIPHPSGVNRRLNDPDELSHLRVFLQRFKQ